MNSTLSSMLGTAWWLVLLRGIAAIVFGVFAYASPGVTLIALAYCWGFYALFDGVTAISLGWKARDSGKPMWPMILLGILGVAAGLFTFVSPGITALSLLMLIGGWAIVTGVLQIIAAIRIRKEIDNEWMLILSGVLSIVFGGLMLANPGAGALSVLWIIGAFAVVYGVLLVLLSFKVKKLAAGFAPA